MRKTKASATPRITLAGTLVALINFSVTTFAIWLLLMGITYVAEILSRAAR